MANEKMTKAVAFNMAIKALENREDMAEVVEILKGQIALLEKRKENKTTKPSKEKLENERIKNVIEKTLAEVGCGLRISDLVNTEELKEFSPNKINALVSQLRKEGRVKRYYEKKVAYFTIGNETEIETEVEGE